MGDLFQIDPKLDFPSYSLAILADEIVNPLLSGRTSLRALTWICGHSMFWALEH